MSRAAAHAAAGPSSPAGRTTASLSAGPSVPPVAGIEAEAVRLRTDEAVGGQVQVRVTNTGEQPFTATSVAIGSPGFTALPAKAETATHAPRQVIDLPTPFGDPVCDVDAEPAAALLTVVGPDGATEELRVPPRRGDPDADPRRGVRRPRRARGGGHRRRRLA